MVLQENWWCPPEEYNDIQDDWFIHFFEQGCRQFDEGEVTSNCISVYTVFGHQKFPDKTQQQDNVNFLFIGENTHIHQEHPLYFTMDAVLTFFHDSPKSIRLPLWMIYWNFHTDGLFPNIGISRDDGHHHHHHQNDDRPDDTRRINKAVIVISHDNHEIRRQICSKVISIWGIGVDSNFENVPHEQFVQIPKRGVLHKRNLLRHYKYNVCAENSYKPGYVTEKIFEAFFSGCIPIYWGHVPVEPQIIRPHSYINSFDQSPQHDPSIQISSSYFWTTDAIVHIYATYLKIWSIVFKKRKLKKLKGSCELVVYMVCDMSECYDLLGMHWKQYHRFWTPRPHFKKVDFLSGKVIQEIFMEELADEMYVRYKTTY